MEGFMAAAIPDRGVGEGNIRPEEGADLERSREDLRDSSRGGGEARKSPAEGWRAGELDQEDCGPPQVPPVPKEPAPKEDM
jgi:hypothetical protein